MSILLSSNLEQYKLIQKLDYLSKNHKNNQQQHQKDLNSNSNVNSKSSFELNVREIITKDDSHNYDLE